MKTTVKFPDDDDWKRNDAIAQAIKNIRATPSFAAMTGRSSPVWGQYSKASSVLSDMVNRTYEQFHIHRWFENVLPPAARVSFMTDIYKQLDVKGIFDGVASQVDTQRWLSEAVPKAFSAIGRESLASVAGQQDWLKDIYPRVDQSIFADLITRNSDWQQTAAAITTTGMKVADSVLNEEFIESLVSETYQRTYLVSAEDEPPPEEPDHAADVVREYILKRLADWTQVHYPKLEARAILILNQAATSVAYGLIMSLIPAALTMVLGPVDSVFPIALLYGMVHFYSNAEIRRLSPAQAKSLKSQCPYCKAAPGAQCVTIRGNNIGQKTRMHSKR